MYRASIALVAALGAASVVVDAAIAVEIEWVVVDAVGNPPDDEEMTCCFELTGTTGFGSVPYLYRISRFEITNDQYAEYLNAIASSDPNRVYATNMAGELGGLVRSGPNGSYTYSPKPGLEDHPVNYMDVYRAFRFANWLHNGKPSGPQDASTTEDGSYTLLGTNPAQVQRNPEARFFVPSEDEWYKAAYYDPVAQTYFDWAMGADPRPDADPPPGGSNTCNYVFPPRSCPDVTSGICAQTAVGSYPDSPSPFGTYDQCGNLWEVTETPAVAEAQIIVRGSSWAGGFIDAASFGRNDAAMSCPNGCWGVGMRIAALVPECSDGLDNDGDGLTDAEQDPGCDGLEDASERSALRPCDDGVDNDGDGFIDYDPTGVAGDIGCRDPGWLREDPKCADGLDNDGDGFVDFDGGAAAGLPPAEQTAPDPECELEPWRYKERTGCGLGAEIVLLLPLASLLSRQRSRKA